jgi:hypothetical protein
MIRVSAKTGVLSFKLSRDKARKVRRIPVLNMGANRDYRLPSQ